MPISKSLKELAETLQENADQVLAEAEHNPALLSLVADVVAGSIVRIEKAAEELQGVEPTISSETLETIAQLATTLDESGDDLLRKKASLLDELLVTISAPKNAVAQAKKQAEDELKRLRDKYRANMKEQLYQGPHNAHERMNNTDKIRKAVKEQVKEYRPLETSLSTRYCPDHPGAGMTRIADNVYQCILDKKIYNWDTGFSTQKGNFVPGGGVQHQVSDWGDRNSGHAVFDTRNSLMSRFAGEKGKLTKNAQQDYQFGMAETPTGKMIEVRIGPEVDENRKLEIIREIQNVMGDLYPIVFKQASVDDEFVKLAKDLMPHSGSQWVSIAERKHDIATVNYVQDHMVHYSYTDGSKGKKSLGKFIEDFDPYMFGVKKKV